MTTEKAETVYSAFISYASKDAAKAQEICASLETRGFRCWIAPRDVRAGHEYGDEIIRGIQSSRCLILVLSEAANESPFVRREVERAVAKRKPVFPIRVEEVMPAPGLELFVSTTHWIDAWQGPLNQHLDRLVRDVAAKVDERAMPAPEKPRPAPKRAKSRAVIVGAAALAVVGIAVASWSLVPRFSGDRTAPDTVALQAEVASTPPTSTPASSGPASSSPASSDPAAGLADYRSAAERLQSDFLASQGGAPPSGQNARGAATVRLDTLRREHFTPVTTFQGLTLEPMLHFEASPALRSVVSSVVREISGQAPVTLPIDMPIPLQEGDNTATFVTSSGESIGPFTWRFEREAQRLEGMKQALASGNGPLLMPVSGGVRGSVWGFGDPFFFTVYCPALRSLRVGASADNLEHVLAVRWNAEQRQCAMDPVPVSASAPELFHQVEFFDGSLSSVRVWRAQGGE